MLHYEEANPLPEECQNCKEEGLGCNECDFLGERFILPPQEEEHLKELLKAQKKRMEDRKRGK